MISKWQKDLINKNLHSVFTRCFDCSTWGVGLHGCNSCGNCNSKNTVEYYDAMTINKLLRNKKQVLISIIVLEVNLFLMLLLCICGL